MFYSAPKKILSHQRGEETVENVAFRFQVTTSSAPPPPPPILLLTTTLNQTTQNMLSTLLVLLLQVSSLVEGASIQNVRRARSTSSSLDREAHRLPTDLLFPSLFRRPSAQISLPATDTTQPKPTPLWGSLAYTFDGYLALRNRQRFSSATG